MYINGYVLSFDVRCKCFPPKGDRKERNPFSFKIYVLRGIRHVTR